VIAAKAGDTAAGPLVLRVIGSVKDLAALNRGFSRVRKGNAVGVSSRRVDELEIIWQPPLSIFKVEYGIPVGQFELIMTPKNASQFPLSAIESTAPKVLGDFKFEVTDLYFMCHQAQGPRVDTTQYMLDLAETRCQQVQLTSVSFSQRSFDVSPSTHALTVAFQDGRTDQTVFPASRLRWNNGQELQLQRLFLDYGGQQKPKPDADPKFDARVDLTTQRYMETQLARLACTSNAEDPKA